MSDLPDYVARCEVTTFHGRDEDDWYLLEWWPTLLTYVIYEAPKRPLQARETGR